MRCPQCDGLNLEDSTVCFNCGTPLVRPSSPYAAPGASQEASRKGFRPIWILWGCGGLAVLLLLLMGSCFLVVKAGMSAGDREFRPAVESYFAKVQVGDYRGAYREFGTEMHQVVKEEDYVAQEPGFQERLGNLKTKTVQFFGTGVDTKGRWGRIVYACEFEHAKGTLTISLRKAGDSWKIAAIRYNSPVFPESLKSKNTPKTGSDK